MAQLNCCRLGLLPWGMGPTYEYEQPTWPQYYSYVEANNAFLWNEENYANHKIVFHIDTP